MHTACGGSLGRVRCTQAPETSLLDGLKCLHRHRELLEHIMQPGCCLPDLRTATRSCMHCGAALNPAELHSLPCRCFEGALAALAAPLVGYLAEHVFGLHGTAAPTGDPSVDLPKARALGSALLILTAVPWTLCLLLYSGMACLAIRVGWIPVSP